MFKKYNIRDVETEMGIQQRLAKFPVPAQISNEYHLDQEINDCGVRLDMYLVDAAVDMDTRSRNELTNTMKAITELESPNSVQQMKAWLSDNGLQTDTLGKKAVTDLLKTARLHYRYQQGKVQINHNRFLGYTKDTDGNLVIDPEQAETVKRIDREYLEDLSMNKIAAGLERDGILTGAGGKKWHTSTINKILRNEKYIDDALLQKTYTTDFLNKTRVKNNGLVPQYYVEGDHEAIIPKDIYLQVQEELIRRRVVKTSANGKISCSRPPILQNSMKHLCGAGLGRSPSEMTASPSDRNPVSALMWMHNPINSRKLLTTG